MFSDVEFRLRSRVKADSKEAVVIKYLNSKNTLYPAKDMAMIAISSYWLPLAYQAVDQSVNLEQHIRACLYRLQLHSSYLMGLLGEIPSQGVPMIAVASNQSQPLQLIQSEPLRDFQKIKYTSYKNDNHSEEGRERLPQAASPFP
ncbi:MAG: hypothetical protein V7K47_28825, partial [Nostoc sp.]